MKIKKTIEIVLAAILSATSFIQMIQHDTINLIFQNHYVIIFLIICALGLGCILACDLYDLCHTIHHFKKGSPKFCRFFAKWYSKAGVLTLICDDLNWTASKINGKAPILDALELKANSNELVLYLSRQELTNPEILRKLASAKIKTAQANIVNNYSFSCLNYMGNNSAVIVRDKNKDRGNEVIFQEVADTYVTRLLNALLED